MDMGFSGVHARLSVLILAMLGAGSTMAADDHHQHDADHQMDHSSHQMDMASMDHSGHMDHARHMAMMKNTDYKRSSSHYHFPDVTLLNQDGEKVALKDVLANDKPVVLNFIFTTCTTICPVMSATFSGFDHKLTDAEKAEVRMVSISIDPEQDRPKALRKYAEKFSAGDNWTFLTGSLDDIIHVLKSFDAYRGNKMNHEPVTLLRKAGAMEWVRLDGLTSARDLVAEYRKLSGSAQAEHHDHHEHHDHQAMQ